MAAGELVAVQIHLVHEMCVCAIFIIAIDNRNSKLQYRVIYSFGSPFYLMPQRVSLNAHDLCHFLFLFT